MMKGEANDMLMSTGDVSNRFFGMIFSDSYFSRNF